MARRRAQARSGARKGASVRQRIGKLPRGERIAAVAAILLFASMFLPWFGHPSAVQRASEEVGFHLDIPEVTRNAWDDFSFTDIVLLLAALSGLAAAVAAAYSGRADLARGLSRAVAGFGSLGTLLVLYRLIDPPDEGSPRPAAFAGLVLAGALALAGYRLMEEHGLWPQPRRPRPKREPRKPEPRKPERRRRPPPPAAKKPA